tara:strand:+ start:580 stop:987 length:408 start_codon:yes stop_codon:yes gene_type:complete
MLLVIWSGLLVVFAPSTRFYLLPIVIFLFPLILMFRHIEVSINSEEVVVIYGLGKWPRLSIPLEEIVNAGVVKLKFRDVGGYGYRGSLRFFKRAWITLRFGDHLYLELTRGRRLYISVDNPSGAVDVLSGLVFRF